MKFYPKKHLDLIESYSIVWSNRYGGYMLTNSGKDVGDVIVNLEQALQIINNNYECLKELGLGLEDHIIYEANAYLDSVDVTNTQNIKISFCYRHNNNQLPFGVFRVVSTDMGIVFKPFKGALENKNIIENKNLKDMIIEFFNTGNEGRKNKKGILLFGPPGNGKTTEIMSLFPLVEEMQVRLFLVDPNVRLNYMTGAKPLLEKDRTIFIMEEITERTGGQREIEHLLTFLDGETSWNNCVTVATTNYPEEMPANLIDRPGRFDTFIEYSNPKKDDIRRLGEKFGFSEEDVVSLTGRDFSFDYCSYIMSVAKKNNTTVKEALVAETEKRRKISSTFKGKMGIN